MKISRLIKYVNVQASDRPHVQISSFWQFPFKDPKITFLVNTWGIFTSLEDPAGRLGLAAEQFWMNASRQDLHVQAVALAVSLGNKFFRLCSLMRVLTARGICRGKPDLRQDSGEIFDPDIYVGYLGRQCREQCRYVYVSVTDSKSVIQ